MLETKVQRELSPCFLGNLSYEFLYESIRKKDGAINEFYLRKNISGMEFGMRKCFKKSKLEAE